MEKQILAQAFATVDLLDKCLKTEGLVIKESSNLNPLKVASHFRQKNIVEHMRQVANNLQLEYARSDGLSFARLLNIFKGLHSMLSLELTVEVKRSGIEPLFIHSDSNYPVTEKTDHKYTL